MGNIDSADWLKRLGQTQLLEHLNLLAGSSRAKLEAQLQIIDWQTLENLLSPNKVFGPDSVSQALEPMNPHPLGSDIQIELSLAEAFVRARKLALFTLAGGQGSRLGFEGPKGCFGITPVRNYPLFGVFSEKLLAAQSRFGVEIPWTIMTSPQNNGETVDFFEKHRYFGLKKDKIHFFVQGTMPIIDSQTGQLLLESNDSLALAPDGTGGAFKALYRSGALDWLKKKGVKTLSYIQVDNPLITPVDALFLGVHLNTKSQYSSKAVKKMVPEEKVGVFAKRNGALTIVEYIDMPKETTQRRDAEGNLLYGSANIAAHLIEIAFIEKISKEGSLPYHRAHKKEPFWDGARRIAPEKPNAFKFEQFSFEALPFASNPIVFETRREEEFSPAKNAEGVDSPAWCRRDQLRQWARWLKAVGVDVPSDAEGTPKINFEITPLFADSVEALKAKAVEGELPKTISEGMVL